MAQSSYSYKPGGLLLKLFLIAAAVNVAVSLASAASSVAQLRLLNRMAAGEEVPQPEIDGNDSREALIGISHVPLSIAAFVLMLMIVYRANANAHAMGVNGLNYTPGWSVGWFFIPIMNLFKPYAAVRDTWRASDPANADWSRSASSPLVGAWWAIWIVSSLLGRAVFRLNLRAEELEDFRTATVVTLVSLAVDVVLWPTTAVLFHRLFSMQAEKHARFGTSGPPESACAGCGEPLPPGAPRCPVCGREAFTNV